MCLFASRQADAMKEVSEIPVIMVIVLQSHYWSTLEYMYMH